MAIGTQGRRPPDTVMAPKEAPTIASARQTRAMARRLPASGVRQNDRLSPSMNKRTCVRQAERLDVWSEHVGNGSQAEEAGAPALISLIAASIRRERDRAGLSLTELARRAGIAKST